MPIADAKIWCKNNMNKTLWNLNIFYLLFSKASLISLNLSTELRCFHIIIITQQPC